MPGRERLRVSYVAHVVSELYVLTTLTCLKRTVSMRFPRYCTGIVLTRAAHARCPYSLARCKCVQVSLSARYRRGGIYGRPSEVLQKSQLHQDATRARATAYTPGSSETEILPTVTFSHGHLFYYRNKCVVSAEHVLTRYGPREFCLLIGQLNLGSAE